VECDWQKNHALIRTIGRRIGESKEESERRRERER
jgi:hypothetical protein